MSQDLSQTSGVSDIAISPDSSMIATANDVDSTVLLWDAQSYEILNTLDGHEAGGSPIGVLKLEFSPDSRLLATGSWVHITLWNTQTGQYLQDYTGSFMQFSPDSGKLATGFGRVVSSVEVWDTQTQEQLINLQAPLDVSELQWTADSTTIIGNFTDFPLLSGYYEWTGEMIRSWNVETGTPLHTFAIPTQRSIPVQLETDETLIGIGVAHGEGMVLVWNSETEDVYTKPMQTAEQTYEFQVTTETILDFQLSPDQTLLAATVGDKADIWNFASGEHLLTIQDNGCRMVDIEWLLNSSTLVVQCDSGILSLWDISNE